MECHFFLPGPDSRESRDVMCLNDNIINEVFFPCMNENNFSYRLSHQFAGQQGIAYTSYLPPACGLIGTS